MTIIDQLEFDIAQVGVPANGMQRAALNAERPWWDRGMGLIRTFAASGLTFDAYDLTKAGLPAPDHPNRFGALFNAARTQGLIKNAGYHKSERPGRSKGVCAIWVGVPGGVST